ncbi:ABC transporter permease [Fusobacterium perfoetens]|uniref:ABC transporter permease n=1 Tax=Fusobacterium perfoetens TaxID=852 RepID=UPI000487F683|nr:ABC transporter permease [Fusobacterium perfoetens]MCI6152447.1 ABC transporter permease [Fusobacterium perfoetens]MDY3237046.1 ABC transporter permease [Fusobacterium perfoetens]
MKNNKKGILYTVPITIWLTAFFLIPMLIVLVYSFLKKGIYGGVELKFTLESFNIFKNPIFLSIVYKTLFISILVTVITIIIAIPTAYFIVRSKYKEKLIYLIIIPFWTNFLIRIYAWMAILGSNGFINMLLKKFGFIDNSIQFLYNTWAVILISVYTSLPFAILPLYATIDKFDFSLMEAARDLGATNKQSFFKIFLPNIKNGIMTASIFTFVPMLGSYIVPKLVGGTNSIFLGNVIARHLTETRNWPMASTISSVLILVTIIILVIGLIKQERGELNG